MAPRRNSRRTGLRPLLLATFMATFSFPVFAQNTSIYKNTDKKDTVIAGFKPAAGSDPNYRIYAGVSYSIVRYSAKKDPYAASHTIGLNYSFSENSFHPYYENLFPDVIGKWGVYSRIGYDQVRRANYFGLGNEVRKTTDNIRFNWLRSHHQFATLGLARMIGTDHQLNWGLLYDAVQVLDDNDRFIAKSRRTIDSATFNWQYFLGTRLSYTYRHLNDPHLPTKGFTFNSAVSYQESLKRSGHSFARYSTDLEAYLPLPGDFSLAFRTGLATLTGNPDFYMYNVIGGNRTLRGFHRWRYYGKTAFYDQNELRWIREVDKGSVYGRFGFLALYDIGRVWLPGETSDKLHFGYGAGLILAPFNKVTVTAVYAISNEDKRLHFTAGKSF
jgi:outer membrane protein assembly factor BamA